MRRAYGTVAGALLLPPESLEVAFRERGLTYKAKESMTAKGKWCYAPEVGRRGDRRTVADARDRSPGQPPLQLQSDDLSQLAQR